MALPFWPILYPSYKGYTTHVATFTCFNHILVLPFRKNKHVGPNQSDDLISFPYYQSKEHRRRGKSYPDKAVSHGPTYKRCNDFLEKALESALAGTVSCNYYQFIKRNWFDELNPVPVPE